ncbi:MAG: methyltransferase RsmF C-terminal domain-like protein [Prevotella sp.]|jgi:16S rRNA C967 or C1407 C5-methylase (RsmB/RsmF family)/NOL1/NOP2/fmu family ribosome biogenesis protein
MLLPHDFEKEMRPVLGDERYGRLAAALTEDESPVSVRLNPFKINVSSIAVPDADGKVPWCSLGRYLSSRPAFTFDPLLHAGTYYVQEASSMFLAEVLRRRVSSPVLMLDLCAAPGGKSTVARSVLPAGSVVVSNEPDAKRASVLVENVRKFGHPDTVVTRALPADYRRSGLVFDVVLTDVPCSGEGMFRKDSGAADEWSLSNVARCRQLQRTIVADAWHCLRPGGLLVYSTCTFNTAEDEENVEWICEELGAEPLSMDMPAEWGVSGAVTGNLPVFRFFPGRTRGEGLFMAVLRKPGEAGSALSAMMGEERRIKSAKHKKNSHTGADRQLTELCERWLVRNFKDKEVENESLQSTFVSEGDDTARRQNKEKFVSSSQETEGWALRQHDDEWWAVPRRWAPLYDRASFSLHLLHAGVPLGVQRGRDFVPHAALPLSLGLRRDGFPEVNLTWDEAMTYLRREAVSLPADTPRGFVVVSYEGFPLGFEKNMGNRANNLYPAEWRIRSSHLPAEPVVVLRP